MTPEKLRELEASREAVETATPDSYEVCWMSWKETLHSAAPELIEAAHRLQALEKAIQQFIEEVNGSLRELHWIQERADYILKERSK